ncbi:hypothetical protein GCM10025734_14300 [Kitasatospora paranensis]
MQGPDDVHVPDLVEQAGHPGALLGEEARVLLVGAPVLEVVLAVGDVPVAADQHLAAVLGGPAAQRVQVDDELRHEAFLLVLALGADLAGRQVEAGDGQAREVDLGVAARAVELGGAEADGRPLRLPAREHGDTGAALGGGRRPDRVPPVELADLGGDLLLLGPDLLEADHVGLRAGEPLHEALLGGRPDAVDVHCRNHDHPARLPDPVSPVHWS